MSNHQLTRWVLRHSWSLGLRRASLGAAVVLAAGVVLIAPSALSRGVPSASADDCPDAEVTFARGTDEPPGLGRVGQALVDSLRQQTGMNIGAYAVNYKASLLQLHTDDGSKDAVSHIKSMADKCPNTPQVLGGYSQGASVIDIVTGDSVGGLLRGTTLPAQYANIVTAVVTFGNVADRSGAPITTQSPLFGSTCDRSVQPQRPDLSRGPRQRMERAHRGLRTHLHRPGGELRRRQALGGPTSHYVRAFCDARTVYGGRIAHYFPLTGPIGRVISGRGPGYLVREVGLRFRP
jgi:cutinase